MEAAVLAADDAGVVAEHVDVAEAVDGLVSEGFDGFALHRVDFDADDAALLLFQARDCRVERVGFDVGEDDVHALGGEALGEGVAHSRGSAGDDGGAVAEVAHDGLFLDQLALGAAFHHLLEVDLDWLLAFKH